MAPPCPCRTCAPNNLLLTAQAHPDKRDSPASREGTPGGSTSTTLNGDSVPDIVLVNEARAVLSDPTRRAAFDAERARPYSAQPPAPSGPRIREYVSLETFTPHVEDESNPDAEPHQYTLECRCGQEYVITLEELEAGVDVIGCPGCGEYIGVEYEEVDE